MILFIFWGCSPLWDFAGGRNAYNMDVWSFSQRHISLCECVFEACHLLKVLSLNGRRQTADMKLSSCSFVQNKKPRCAEDVIEQLGNVLYASWLRVRKGPLMRRNGRSGVSSIQCDWTDRGIWGPLMPVKVCLYVNEFHLVRRGLGGLTPKSSGHVLANWVVCILT